jgi:hypothetical protein
VRNPIDAFITAEHEKHGLKARPEAPRHVLLRRIYLDLIGLPPTPEELNSFLKDTSTDAYEKVVDKLLASPHYGERWGRHWMDIWRYSDWAGYGAEVRDSQPHIWRWRDWIIESLNADKSYNRMILEMLAGDELAPEDQDVLRATGFLVRNWYKFSRHVWLDRTIEHTAKAFLGVTLNCARCHDHFYDPITQQEYYQFRAFFEPHDIRTDKVRGGDPVKDGLVRVFDARLDPQTFLFIRGEDKNPDKKNSLTPAVPASLGGNELAIKPVTLPAAAVHPEKQAWVKEELLKSAQHAIEKARAAREKAKDTEQELTQLDLDVAEAKFAALKATLDAEAIEDAGIKGKDWEVAAREANKLQRQASVIEAKRNVLQAQRTLNSAKAPASAALKKKLDDAQKAVAKAEELLKQPVTTAYTRRSMPTYPATSSGRRLALARWIADKDNPLTARVAMNHLWLRHFGKPLVLSVFDFGRNGQPPTHPALLDWLADEFMQRGWSTRAMHRLMVTSSSYRMDSSNDPRNAELDTDNRYLWRMNARRMEAEIIRDSVLHIAGQLDLTRGGPELDQSLGLTTRRRSIYYRHAPEKMVEFLTLFDAASVTECYMRTESVVPQQALALANSSLALAQSRILAGKLGKQVGTAAASTNQSVFVKLAFEHLLGRPPTTQEQALCENFLTTQVTLLSDKKGLTAFPPGPASTVPPAAEPNLRARENLVHVLMNHNEFVTIR